MNTITKESARYDKIITVFSADHYEVNKDELNPDERVVCPNDDDMFVQKNESGEISLIKNCYSKKPFL